MLGSGCDLKNVRNLGYPIPIQIEGAQATFFRRLHNLTATLTVHTFGTKHDINNPASALAITKGLLYRVKMS